MEVTEKKPPKLIYVKGKNMSFIMRDDKTGKMGWIKSSTIAEAIIEIIFEEMRKNDKEKK